MLAAVKAVPPLMTLGNATPARPCAPGSRPASATSTGISEPGVQGRGVGAEMSSPCTLPRCTSTSPALTAQALARPALMLNDADAAGIAEMRFGNGQGCNGTVVMLTFGTGIGTALFTAGRLFPNTELGHLELRGMDAEKWASAHTRTVAGLDFPGWIARVNEYLDALHRLLWPDVFILGGAVSERFSEFAPLLRSSAEIRPARFANQAGVVGAALAAAASDPAP